MAEGGLRPRRSRRLSPDPSTRQAGPQLPPGCHGSRGGRPARPAQGFLRGSEAGPGSFEGSHPVVWRSRHRGEAGRREESARPRIPDSRLGGYLARAPGGGDAVACCAGPVRGAGRSRRPGAHAQQHGRPRVLRRPLGRCASRCTNGRRPRANGSATWSSGRRSPTTSPRSSSTAASWRRPRSSSAGRYGSGGRRASVRASPTRPVCSGESSLASAAARRGLQLLFQAREEFRELGAQAEIVETDARIAGSLARQGLSEGALQVATEALGGASGPIVPVLQRTQGFALVRLGDTEGAREAFIRSLGRPALRARSTKRRSAWMPSSSSAS